MMDWTAARRIVAAVAGAAALAPAAASAAEPHMEEVSYLLAGTAAAHAQIEAGRLAVENAERDEVRAFAQELLGDHERAWEELAGRAAELGVEPLAEPEPAEGRWLDRLAELDGPAFDAVYVLGGVPALATAGWVHEREARHGLDAETRAQAERLREENAEHQDTARRLADAVAADLPEGPHPEDDQYLVYAMNVDLTQVRLGELALERAEDERVRAHARRMVEDHGRSLERFSQAAEARGVPTPEEPGPVTQATRARLEPASGRAFDWDYATGQVIHHFQWFYRYEHEAIHGRDAEVQALAAAGAELAKAHHDAVLDVVKASTDGGAGASGGAGTPPERH